MSSMTYCPDQPTRLPVSQAQQSRGALANAQSLLIRVFDALFAWRDRARGRRQLGTLDERLLHDIGVDRASAAAEAFKPFWRA